MAPSVLFNAEIFADSAAELCGTKSKPVPNHIHNIHVRLLISLAILVAILVRCSGSTSLNYYFS